MEHTEDSITGATNLKLYYRAWLPDTRNPKAILLLAHGLAEHTGRYAHLANYFVQRGYAVYGLDHCGHGKSEGRKCYVNHFSDFVNDLKIFFETVSGKYPGVDIFLVGHSMGGTIATIYAINQAGLSGLILSGATLQIKHNPGMAFLLALRTLVKIVPRMGTTILDARAISRDKSVVDKYINDPLVYRGKISVRLASELLTAISKLPAHLRKINAPVLIMHGTTDRLSDPAGSKMLYDKVGSQDKTLKLYDGLFHEIFNEPEHKQVFSDMESWLETRLRQTA